MDCVATGWYLVVGKVQPMSNKMGLNKILVWEHVNGSMGNSWLEENLIQKLQQ